MSELTEGAAKKIDLIIRRELAIARSAASDDDGDRARTMIDVATTKLKRVIKELKSG